MLNEISLLVDYVATRKITGDVSLATIFVDYIDKDWQYFWVIYFGVPNWKDVRIPAEPLFADVDLTKPDEFGDPIRDLAWRLIPVKSYKSKIIV